MAEAMELVKEALLSKIKAQVPLIADSSVGQCPNHLELLGESFLNNKSSFSNMDGINLSMDNNSTSHSGRESATELDSSSPVKESRRKTRKPNKTSKVVTETEADTLVTGRSSADVDDPLVEQRISCDENRKDSAAVKRPGNDEMVANDNEMPAEDFAKKPRKSQTRRSNDAGGNNSETDTATDSVMESPQKQNSNGESQNGHETKKTEENSSSVHPPTVVVSPSASPAEPAVAPDNPETSFEEVENKLTEMFAGIADSVGDAPPPKAIKRPSTPPLPARKAPPPRRKSVCLSMLIGDVDIDTDDDEDFSLETTKKPVKAAATRKRPPAKKPAPKSNSAANSGATPAGGNKKRGGKASAAANKKKKKKASPWEEEILPPALKKQPKEQQDEGRYRGPLLQVRQDGSLGVLNGPQGQAEDDADARNGGKAKKFLHNGADRHKAMRGLHTNTLSMKYDTDRTDTTWICVFCKLGPHKLGLGDLFGPYVVTTDCDEFRAQEANAEDLFKRNRSRVDMVQTAPHRLPAVPATVATVATAALLKSPNSKIVSIIGEFCNRSG